MQVTIYLYHIDQRPKGLGQCVPAIYDDVGSCERSAELQAPEIQTTTTCRSCMTMHRSQGRHKPGKQQLVKRGALPVTMNVRLSTLQDLHFVPPARASTSDLSILWGVR